MRLINVKSYEIQEFAGYAPQVPDYAILSHTWGKDEVSFQDMQDLKKAAAKEGFKKIEYCCRQAAKDGWQWAWVDTCCIDKTSSSELSEAINSMYKWYAASMVCYAYIGDVSIASEFLASTPPSTKDDKVSWSVSRWFYRGWTLQELIAPFTVIFYTNSWKRIGTKWDWSDQISTVTSIPKSVLNHSTSIRNIPVLDRMRWASARQTTRKEDTAYCLLGIFDINMPLLYGEGERAFERLQEQILRTTDDQTLFLWCIFDGIEAESVIGRITHPVNYWAPRGSELCGILAPSPSEFDRDIPVTLNSFGEFSDPQMTTRHLGLRLTLPIRKFGTGYLSKIPLIQHLKESTDNIYMAAINCEIDYLRKDSTQLTPGRVILFLFHLTGSPQPLLFCRIRYLIHTMPEVEVNKWPRKTIYIREPIHRKKMLLLNDIRRIGDSSSSYIITRRLKSEGLVDVTFGGRAGFVLENPETANCLFITCIVQIDEYFCHTEEFKSVPSKEEIDELWRKTDSFERKLSRSWKDTYARCGLIYESYQRLSESKELLLFIKREEAFDSETMNMYMKLSD
jgi:Heterokaryon incompatibility protein (HET)